MKQSLPYVPKKKTAPSPCPHQNQKKDLSVFLEISENQHQIAHEGTVSTVTPLITSYTTRFCD